MVFIVNNYFINNNWFRNYHGYQGELKEQMENILKIIVMHHKIINKLIEAGREDVCVVSYIVVMHVLHLVSPYIIRRIK